LTPPEVKALVGAARALEPRGARVPLVYPTLFGLIACTGLRISEALNLQRQDVTAEGLVVRHTKFGKSRLLPLHPTTRRALDQYLERRYQETGTGEYVFLSVRTPEAPREYGPGRFRSTRPVPGHHLRTRPAASPTS
jgi:integrase